MGGKNKWRNIDVAIAIVRASQSTKALEIKDNPTRVKVRMCPLFWLVHFHSNHPTALNRIGVHRYQYLVVISHTFTGI